jgi:3-oxoacyl-[acyl-carrier protein] reductase
MTSIDAQQRIAIVTGAARGIGAAVTLRLAADGLGVAVLDRDKDGAEAVASSITRTGGRAMAITADVTSSEQIEDAVASVCAGLGDPTVLVNNAGVLHHHYQPRQNFSRPTPSTSAATTATPQPRGPRSTSFERRMV